MNYFEELYQKKEKHNYFEQSYNGFYY